MPARRPVAVVPADDRPASADRVRHHCDDARAIETAGSGAADAPRGHRDGSGTYGVDHVDFRGGVFRGPVTGKRTDKPPHAH
ncbi:hypothetical protein [Streptomyces sp. NPDC101237]|uniref:hypothetical protein n=1 Tax=Streptomyces sp. NPDC101237 TaxID=3366139 RepID=UPI003824BD5C